MLIENYFSSEPWPPHQNVYWNYGLASPPLSSPPTYHQHHRRTSAHSSSSQSPDVCRNLNYHIAHSSNSSSSMESLYSSNSASTFDFDDDEKGFRRVSVIVKATKPSAVMERRVISLEHVCRWENCYRWGLFLLLLSAFYGSDLLTKFFISLLNILQIESLRHSTSSRIMWTQRTAPLA